MRAAGQNWLAGALVVLCALALCALAMGSAALASSVYTAAKLSVDMTAKDAVTAKEEGIADAEQRALRTVLKRLTPLGAQERLPRVKPDLVEDMMVGFVVRSEAFSGKRYTATLDFEFQPGAVQQLLRGYNIPFADQQAAPVKVLPVYLKDGKVQTGPRDVWRAAWVKLDTANALTPVQLLQPGSTLTQETVGRVLAGDRDAYEALGRQYSADRLVLAVAEPREGDSRLATRLYGADAIGGIDLVRVDRVFADGLAPAAGRAAHIALRVIESRWKIRQSPAGADADASADLTVSAAVEFSGMREWQEIRSRLARVPGVQSLSVNSLSARGATVTFQFAGGADRLGAQLASRNLALEDRGGTWILRNN